MARGSKNIGYWYWSARDQWMHTDPTTGKRVKLAEGKASEKQAKENYAKLIAAGGYVAVKAQNAAKALGIAQAGTVEALVAAWLHHMEGELPPDSHYTFTAQLKKFRNHFGAIAPEMLVPADIQDWVKKQINFKTGKPWTKGQMSHVKSRIKSMYKWGMENKKIKENTVVSLKVGKGDSRKGIFTKEQIEEVRNNATPAFKLLFEAFLHTGARCKEIETTTASQCEFSPTQVEVTQDEWKNGKKTGELRTFTFEGKKWVAIIRRLCIENPDGPIFRNNWGQPWTGVARRKAFARLRVDLGWEGEDLKLVPYSSRHTFATKQLEANPDIYYALAGVMGTSVKMLEEHYGHVTAKHNAKALAKRIL